MNIPVMSGICKYLYIKTSLQRGEKLKVNMYFIALVNGVLFRYV